MPLLNRNIRSSFLCAIRIDLFQKLFCLEEFFKSLKILLWKSHSVILPELNSLQWSWRLLRTSHLPFLPHTGCLLFFFHSCVYFELHYRVASFLVEEDWNPNINYIRYFAHETINNKDWSQFFNLFRQT